jgi:hypothetical protein
MESTIKYPEIRSDLIFYVKEIANSIEDITMRESTSSENIDYWVHFFLMIHLFRKVLILT